MKHISKLISILLILILSSQVVFAAQRFTDTDGHKYEESIQNLKNDGAVEGYDDGSFRPDQPINRAEFTKIVLEALDKDVRNYSDCFFDVDNDWFAKYVCTAKSLGIVEGYADGTFKPENTVNMVEAMSIVVKTFNIDYEQKETEEWFAPFVRFANNNDIFKSQDYEPSDFILRGQMAFLIDRTSDLKKSDDIKTDDTPGGSACGSNPPSRPPETFSVNGVEREAIVVVPSNYLKTKAYPLIFAFHGRTNPNTQVQGYYGIDRAAHNQAIIVYPAGIEVEGGGSFTWSDPGDTGANLRDYEFFDVMLEELTDTYCIDEDKIYAMGHSLGAWFTNSLACARADKLRAVATLGGSRSNSDCKGSTAVMQWHNPNDRLAPFSGAETTRDWYLEQNQCSTTDYIEVQPRDGNCIEYQGCTYGNPVIFCPHEQDYDSFDNYYPHNWPRGTGAEMWDFFQSLD